MDMVVEEWSLTLGVRLEAAGMRSEFGSRVIAASEDTTHPIGGDSAAESDETLMQRYQRGSELAFHELYERYRGPLLRFVRRLSPGTDEDEEIAQETWMAVIQGRERYVPRARFITYLFSIAHRRTLDRWRRRGRSPEFDECAAEPDGIAGPTSYEPDTRASNVALRMDLLSAIAALPILQREAFLLRAEGGLGIEEIAEITSTNRETAKSRLRLAVNRLRTTLEPWA